MITADGKNVKLVGMYCDLMSDLANIIAAFVKSPDVNKDDVFEAIKAGVMVGLEDEHV